MGLARHTAATFKLRPYRVYWRQKRNEGHMTQSLLEAEIFSQPDAIRAVSSQSPACATIAAHISARDPYSVMIAARGTSDNAARYAQYLFGIMLRLPVGLATPSLATLYGTELHFRRALVLGISQSGRSPDICEYVASARRQSALTLAITNVPSSPLAQAAEYHLDIAAGVEQSVAATKTYTNQLATIALLAGHLAGDGRFIDLVATLPDLISAVLAIPQTTIDAAARLLVSGTAAMSIGRGMQYATALEAALKIKELSGMPVEGYSSADVLHGPVTTVEQRFPVLLSGDVGATQADTTQLIQRVRTAGALIVVASSAQAHLDAADVALPIPVCDERLSPIVTIVAWQRVAAAAAGARGRDANAPIGLRKVTETR
jgi:glucosamine--fructose-6-phosphate aminotransferase (isomerizing)